MGDHIETVLYPVIPVFSNGITKESKLSSSGITPVLCLGHTIAVIGEYPLRNHSDDGVVVDDEDVLGLRLHDPTSIRTCDLTPGWPTGRMC